ncbi:unnamed protein product [Bursaphelenchus okinawaensis]|uniref:Uncharacterized protein n=1 Tax=Bursaphelenchus okinawaensis TaxID=465554 RepID=A0A811LEJ9_9BILA|nr:unnamed protein product [Bursaphelenchus okinawaensis]CAG9121759.1 unnamed protein product [Bursaphelenchus okinawaensis]
MQLTKILHSNLKFTLMFLSIILRCLTFTRAIADLFYTAVNSSATTYYICRCMSFLNLFSMGFVQLSFAALVIERAMATIYHSDYESWGNKLAKLLTALFAVNAFVFCLVCFLLETYGVVKEQTQFPTRACGTLTTRFTYHDNVVVLRIYAPVIVFAVFGIGTVCIVIIFFTGIQLLHNEVLSRDIYTLFKCTFLLTDVAAISIEMVLVRFHPSLWNNVKKSFPCIFTQQLQSTAPIDVVHETNVYFGQLHAAWK